MLAIFFFILGLFFTALGLPLPTREAKSLFSSDRMGNELTLTEAKALLKCINEDGRRTWACELASLELDSDFKVEDAEQFLRCLSEKSIRLWACAHELRLHHDKVKKIIESL